MQSQTENNEQLSKEFDPANTTEQPGSNADSTAAAGKNAGYDNDDEISNRNEEGETAEEEMEETLKGDDEWDEEDTMGDDDDKDDEDRA